jgi:acyl phosphate:glycerol-3-phosphate acyltransferase
MTGGVPAVSVDSASMNWTVAAVIAFAYLLGSVDFGVHVARARGVDIYAVGSGNPGTANVGRALGWKAAAAVLVGDFLKGVVAAGLGWLVVDVTVGFAAGFAAVVGHCFPVWHRFRGGKGVATAGGGILVMAPLVGIALAAIWAAVAKFGKISSVASLTVAVVALPALVLAGHRGWALVWTGLMMVLVLFQHRANIGRLIRGEEHVLTPSPTE